MSDGPDPQALGLAGGILWGGALLLGGLLSMAIPAWQPFVDAIGQFYLGYAPTVTGSIMGGIWGFVDVGLGLYLFAWLYRYFRENPVF